MLSAHVRWTILAYLLVCWECLCVKNIMTPGMKVHSFANICHKDAFARPEQHYPWVLIVSFLNFVLPCFVELTRKVGYGRHSSHSHSFKFSTVGLIIPRKLSQTRLLSLASTPCISMTLIKVYLGVVISASLIYLCSLIHLCVGRSCGWLWI